MADPRPLVIAIDGPASSGKGTVARAVARRLGLPYVDTGAMYRAVALVARERGVSWDDGPGLAEVARGLDLAFAWDGEVLRLSVDGRDVSEAIRTAEVGRGASDVSRHPAVRAALLGPQRALGRRAGVVMDGRDIGTVVLPDADLKVYLDASLGERARRRWLELRARGEDAALEEVERALAARDRQDSEREVAPLRVAPDAVVVDTTGLGPAEAVEAVARLALALRPS